MLKTSKKSISKIAKICRDTQKEKEPKELEELFGMCQDILDECKRIRKEEWRQEKELSLGRNGGCQCNCGGVAFQQKTIGNMEGYVCSYCGQPYSYKV